MIKQLLSFAAIAAAVSFGANADTLDLSLSDLNAGWDSSYDAATKTITYDDAWKGRGWWLGGVDYSKYDEVVVEFEPVSFDVKLVVEYGGDPKPASSDAMAPAGKTKAVVELNPEYKNNVSQIYIQNSAKGTLTLTAAYLQNAAVFDPTAPVVLWTGDQALDWWANAIKIPVSDFKAARPQVGDELAVTYTVPDGGGALKLQLLEAGWSQHILPGFEKTEGYSTEHGTVHFEQSGTFKMPLIAADVTDLTDAAANQALMLVGENFTVSKVELLRKGESGVENIVAEADANAPVNVYNIAGQQVRANVAPAEAVEGLAPGFYIVGNKKVLVK